MPHATATTPDFVVADLSLADAGRHQLRLAENEMPGLMAYIARCPSRARTSSTTTGIDLAFFELIKSRATLEA